MYKLSIRISFYLGNEFRYTLIRFGFKMDLEIGVLSIINNPYPRHGSPLKGLSQSPANAG